MVQQDARNGNKDWLLWLRQHGPWAVLSAILLWQLLDGNAKQLAATLATVQETRAEVASHAVEAKAVTQKLDLMQRDQIALMRRICINTAKDDNQRQECLR